MLKIMRNKKAQTVLEYAVLLAVIALAVAAMKNYVRRGYQGKLRQEADELGQQFGTGTTVYTKQGSTSISREKSDGTASGSASNSYSKQASKEKGQRLSDEYEPPEPAG